jgi:AGZA family xanthine/uracil permease-like MFS transporter
VAAQADLLDEEGRIENGNKALSSDSVSSIFAGVVGGTPAAVFIVLTGNIVTGIMLGFAALVIGRKEEAALIIVRIMIKNSQEGQG